ncbi:ABC transporter substrate-binding protein [Arthrobacter sp. 18067]|uniref:ABC transporter substrate-binding protein n=1 Tax=Arthrobacter sp. 18067 TaxID=2681413 RepID=UPI0013569270|nr:ABC transporter substrate-binding protein [Arthrobacter sp. 18067]
MTKLKMLTGAVTALLAASTLAACGSTSASDSGGGTTITLGIMTPLTGPAASSFGQKTIDAAKARIELANASHEIPGVTLKLVSEDEGTSPQTSLAALQRLHEQDHADIVLAAGAFFYGSYRYAVQNKIAVVGDCIDGPECADPNNKTIFATFGSSDNNFPNYQGLPEFFKSKGGTTYCGVGYNFPSTIANGKAMSGSVQAAGMPTPFVDFSFDPGSANFSTMALSIKNAQCDVVGTQMQVADSLSLFTALKGAGVELKASFVQGGYGQELLDDPAGLAAAQGLYMAAGYTPASLKTPGVTRMMDALRTYAGWSKPYPSVSHEWGWFTADTAVTGLIAAAKENDTSPAGFVSALRKVTHDTHGGLTCPVNYSTFGDTQQQFPGNCTYMVKVTGNELVSATGDAPIQIKAIPGTKNG